jgi:hypothetical protein
MLSRLGLNRHVTDDDLTAVWADARLGESSQTAAGTHVRECPACRARFGSLSTWLDGLRSDARQEADDAFPRERLAAQQAQILRRLEAMERPAKVLAFPRFARAISAHHGGRQRWIAAAAAAGLIVGVGLGQVFDIPRITMTDRFSSQPDEITRTANAPDRGGIRTVSRVTSDEDFLYDDGPATARVPESLRSLHEITPSAREYDSR